MSKEKLKVETNGNELITTRKFNAPRKLVFEAHSDCKHLMNWWGPREWPLSYCKMDFRVNGTWHYWKIYEARATGTVQLSPREAKRAEWCSVSRLVELGMISPERAKGSGSLERVWLDWLLELQLLPSKPANATDL